MKNQSGRNKIKGRNVRGGAHKRNRKGRKRLWFRAMTMILLVILLAGAGIILLAKISEQDIPKPEGTENTESIEQEKMVYSQETDRDTCLEDPGGSMEDNLTAEVSNDINWALSADNMNKLIRQQMEMIEEYREESKISFSIFGDSISTFKGYIPDGYYDFFPDNGAVSEVSETWWNPLVEELGLKLYANASSSGSTCTGDSASQDNPQYGCSDLRIDDLTDAAGRSPDIIIVYMGTNDLLQSIPLGDNDGKREVSEGDIQNFSDAYTLILDKLQQRYPDSLIYCCTITRIGAWGTDGLFVEFVNGAGEGLTAADYNECIKQIAANKKVPVIDLYDCGITIDNLQDTTTDGVHPTPLGMGYIKAAVEEKLLLAISEQD